MLPSIYHLQGGIKPIIHLMYSTIRCAKKRSAGPLGTLAINLESCHEELGTLLNVSNEIGSTDIPIDIKVWLTDIL